MLIPADDSPAHLPLDVANQLNESVLNLFSHVMHTLDVKQQLDVLEQQGFAEFKLRNRGRYDIDICALDKTGAFKQLNESGPWMPLIHGILGDDARHIATGCILSLPASVNQMLHSDGDHQSQDWHRTHIA